MMEIYIELLMGCCISFKMFEIRPRWNNWDRFAVAVHFAAIACVSSFFFFVCWFVFYKVKPLNMKKGMERRAAYKSAIDQASAQFKET